MRKMLLGSIVASGMILLGCADKDNGVNVNQTAPQMNDNTVTPALTSIDETKAKDIAVTEAGGGQVIEFSYDVDDVIPHYEITVLNEAVEHEFEISAVDGTILKRSVEGSRDVNTSVTIDEAKAKEVVLAQVPNGTVIYTHLDYDDYRPVYDVTVVDGNYKYEFEVSATDGSIVSQEKELINSSNSAPSGVSISAEQAKEIALKEAGGGVVTEVSLDYEYGYPVYEVTVYNGTIEYDFEISGNDGSIISRDVDYR